MPDEEVDELRQKKQQEMQKQAEAKKIEEQLKTALRMALEERAYDRLINIAAVNKELYLIAAKQLVVAFKRMGRKITEDELMTLLRAIKEQTTTETKIRFHKK